MTVRHFNALEVVSLNEKLAPGNVARLQASSGKTYEVRSNVDGAPLAQFAFGSSMDKNVVAAISYFSRTIAGTGTESSHYAYVGDPGVGTVGDGSLGFPIRNSADFDSADLRARFGEKVADALPDCQGCPEVMPIVGYWLVARRGRSARKIT